MKRIWAPWRMDFILEHDKSKCIFCELPKDKSKDRENLILHRSPDSFVIMNRYPYSNGHIMVVPYGHIPKLSELSGKNLRSLTDLLQLSCRAVEKAMSPDGLNIGVNQGKVAGAGYAGHIHFHIVPRWNGDTNFMPVIGETKVMAEHLENSYKKLAPFFK